MVIYAGVVVSGAFILLASEVWMTADVGGRMEIYAATLAGMVLLILVKFVEGNTITRYYCICPRHLANDALVQGGVTPELTCARQECLPTFAHFLDIPMRLVLVSLGAIRLGTRSQVSMGTVRAPSPRLRPWGSLALSASSAHMQSTKLAGSLRAAKWFRAPVHFPVEISGTKLADDLDVAI